MNRASRNMNKNQIDQELERVLQGARECPQPLLVVDAEFQPVAGNSAFERLAGDARSHAHVSDALRPASSAKPGDADSGAAAHVAAMAEALRAQGSWRGRLLAAGPDGPRPLEIKAWAVRDAEGRIAGYAFLGDETAADRSRESRARRAGRLEASRAALGALAHDFNNALAGVAACVEMAMDMLPEDGEARFELEEAYRACSATRDMLRSVLSLSRGSGLEKTPIALGETLMGLVEELTPEIEAGTGQRDAPDGETAHGPDADDRVDARVEISTGPDVVLAHPDLLRTIVVGLARNALRALRDVQGPRRLRLRLTSVEPDKAASPDVPGASPEAGGRLRLDVEDNGPGVSPDILERVFDPYFSTRPRGEGRGLGLTAVWTAARELGGDVDVVSVPGQGARFSVLLPLAEHAPEEHDAGEAAPGNERGLVVGNPPEGDDPVRLLRSLGYETRNEADFRVAAELFRRDPEAFDFVVWASGSDQDFLDFAADLRSTRVVPLLLGAAGDAEEIGGLERTLRPDAVLRRPYVRGEAARVVRAALDERGEREE